MTVRHLKTFIAVCEHGSTTKAAELLHIAQPAVSQTITELERHYGILLFERIRNRLVLTDFGRLLLAKAKETVSSFDEFEDLARQSEANPLIRIGSSLTIGKLYIPRLLTAVKEQLPRSRTHVLIQRTAVIEEELINGNLDLALVEGRVSSPLLHTEKFARDELVIVCGTAYPFAAPRSLAELVKRDLLLREKGSASRDLLDHLLALHRLTAAPVLESASNQAIIAAVKQGHGIAILPGKLVQPDIENGSLHRVDMEGIDLQREYLIVTRKSKKPSRIRQQLCDLCKRLSI